VSEFAYTLQQFEVEAGRVVEKARLVAREILRRSIAEAQQLKERARTEGERKGLEEGLAQGRTQGRREEGQRISTEASTMVQSMMGVLEGIEAQRKEWVAASQRELIQLALAIAEKIVRASIEVDPDVITRILSRAIELTAQRQQLEIYIHPIDVAAVEAFEPRLKEKFGEVQSIRVIPDEAVPRGGARVQTVAGEVDARIETQLANIKGALLGGGSAPSGGGRS
jgi:flagellar assembly protein FliH